MGCCPDTDIDPLKLESAEKKKNRLARAFDGSI